MMKLVTVAAAAQVLGDLLQDKAELSDIGTLNDAAQSERLIAFMQERYPNKTRDDIKALLHEATNFVAIACYLIETVTAREDGRTEAERGSLH